MWVWTKSFGLRQIIWTIQPPLPLIEPFNFRMDIKLPEEPEPEAEKAKEEGEGDAAVSAAEPADSKAEVCIYILYKYFF